MELINVTAIVTGGAAGLGAAVVREIIATGGRAAILDLAEESGKSLAEELGKNSIFIKCNIADENDVIKAIDKTIEKFGNLNSVVNCAGIISAGKIAGSKGPLNLESFKKTIDINLVGTVNVIRLAADRMLKNTPGEDGERGVIINTASIAAFDGQIGQCAYAASKGGIVAMTLPIARDLADSGIRNNTIAPGIFETAMTGQMPENVKDSLVKMIPFPKRFGKSEEFAKLVLHIIENKMLNGEVIRLDAGVRMGNK
ncbi:MAG: 3-hydroxyacyl-CoA dehydrogenase [Spirochaetae bacterium HGW-Spirochaetae-1]|jgi:NAD(P)-dependent dehydrogenase (short-subunit alcohol dehydrogenase family)|nr:MAG: 3-hydroxyacyl-CoA dehydrogenase [Spirochaetae bacterium HGW-Spirochaetae-1]